MSTTTIILKAKRDRPFRFRHPWVFSGAMGKVEGSPADGDEVLVVDTKKEFIARGLYNSRSTGAPSTSQGRGGASNIPGQSEGW